MRKKNWRSKISLDCPFKVIINCGLCALNTTPILLTWYLEVVVIVTLWRVRAHCSGFRRFWILYCIQRLRNMIPKQCCWAGATRNPSIWYHLFGDSCWIIGQFCQTYYFLMTFKVKRNILTCVMWLKIWSFYAPKNLGTGIIIFSKRTPV